MIDLYVKEIPFASSDVKADGDTQLKDSKASDVEETPKIVPFVTSSEFEKGNPDETLTFDVPESGNKLGLEDMDATIDSTENMDIDSPSTTVETKVGDSSVQPSLEKAGIRMDVGPDVGTSLGQHDKGCLCKTQERLD